MHPDDKTYQGACHCGRTRFTVTAHIDHVRVCDCTICHHRGALIFRVEQDQITFQTPLDDLALYEWGTGTAKDYFCKTCGILPFRRPRHNSSAELKSGRKNFEGWAINTRCLKGFDPASVPVRQIHASQLPLPGDPDYEP